ncbi:MAG: ATP-binding protein [Chloroflexi bacterium]|nr:ATP-binding protein [Chloroflexota bacterium]
MNVPLKIRLIFAFFGVAIAAILSIVIYTNLDSGRQLTNYMHGGQYGVEKLVATLEGFYQENHTWQEVDSVLTSSMMGQGRGGNLRGMMDLFAIADQDGKIIWSGLSYVVGDQAPQNALDNAVTLVDQDQQMVGYLLIDGAPAVQTNTLTPFVEKLQSAVLWAGGIAGLVALLLAILIANQLLKPIKDLTRATSVLSHGDLSTRVKVKGRDEIALLATSFNQMAENLELAEERKKTLTADVAHELRTPIAVQKAQLEAMLDGVLPIDQENLSIVADQTNYLSRMVDDLRILALADAGELQLERQNINLSEWIKPVVERFQLQANLNNYEIFLSLEEGTESSLVNVDSDRLTQILFNLLSNATRYGKKDGTIHVSLKKGSGKLFLSVHDDGQGIPPESLPHLFERFYRHDRARSRDTGGSGLGLSISKKLAQLMSGDLSGKNHTEGGAIFTVELPEIFENTEKNVKVNEG